MNQEQSLSQQKTIKQYQISSAIFIIHSIQNSYSSGSGMKGSRLDDWQQFIEFQKQRLNMKLSPMLEVMMDNCEYILHTQFDKNSKSKVKHKKKKAELSKEYRQAFKEFSRDEKLSYYLRYMRFITQYFEGKDRNTQSSKGMISCDVFIRSFNLKMWKQKKIRLDRDKHIIFAENNEKIKTYVLEDYILRKSKNSSYHCFVLQAINNKPHQKSRTVHIGFKDEGKFNEWFKEVDGVIATIQWNFIVSQLKGIGSRAMTQSSVISKGSQIASEKAFQEPQEYLSKSVLVQSKSNQFIIQQKQLPTQRRNKMETLESAAQFRTLDNNQQQFYSGSEQDQKPVDILKSRRTIIEQIAKMDDLDQIEAITSREEKKVITGQVKQNIFARIMPEYNLYDVQNTINYGSLYDEGNIRILGHLQQPLKIKMFMKLPADFSQKLILNALTQSEASKQQNPQIEQVSLKTLIKSQNSAMMYLKIKAFNKLYRPRDFIFLRHVFLAHNIIYIIDKSIENVSYPPFTTIVRGQLCILWAIKKEQDTNMVIADINMNNQGYLSDPQNVNLVLKFFKGFSNIDKVIRNKKAVLENLNLFNQKWNIVEEYRKQSPDKTAHKSSYRKESVNSLNEEKNGVVGFKKKKTEEVPAQIPNINKNGVHKQKAPQKTNSVIVEKKKEVQMEKQKVQKVEKQIKLKEKYAHMEEQEGEIDLGEVQKKLEEVKHWEVAHGIKRDFDQNGHVIVSKSFIKTKYLLSPLPKKQIHFQEAVKGHPIWKGQWIHDDKVGGIIFVNEKKIEDQKGVLKFILTKIGKNLLSGKSVLNISLPVDIFCAESNLERLLYSLTYAPTLLEPLVKNKNPMQRLKKVIAFGISNSPLYLNMQKPFNPILGETFQCWIDGCPAYAQQISHHPPVAALYYEGRGFRITAQLQSKVELHMNSGCGTNDGIFRIRFEDGMEACYITPGGEVSGLAYGDRKFNMVGKSYFWIQSQNLFVEVVFNPTRKGFFSVGKQDQPTDFFQGHICRVKPDFMEHFHKKKKPPTQKQIIEKRGRVYGIWNKYVQYQQQTLLDIDNQFPVMLQYEAHPLPSDANWRQDIAYRRILEISRAQSEKERLEVAQRKDRKLRESNPNYHHHHKK